MCILIHSQLVDERPLVDERQVVDERPLADERSVVDERPLVQRHERTQTEETALRHLGGDTLTGPQVSVVTYSYAARQH